MTASGRTMREQQGEAGLTHPLGFAAGDEVVDHHLSGVGEVTELGFPQAQRVGVLHGEAGGQQKGV